MTVDTTGAPLMDARNCKAVNKHSLSNTDEYCKIHLKTARCQQNEFVNVSQQYPHKGYWEQTINYYFDRVYSKWVGCEISAFEGLELYDGKLSRTVLRGRRAVRLLATRCKSIVQ